MSTFNPADAGIPRNQIPRASFPLSFARRFTTNFGRLVPFLCEPVLPTDNYEIYPEFILRMAPFVGQVFQQFKVAVDYFFIPNRILWKNFDLFLAGGYDGSTDFVHPYFNLRKFFDSDETGFYTDFQYLNSLLDYLDISPYDRTLASDSGTASKNKNLLPLAAYAKLCLDHYTNQHLDNADLLQDYLQRGWILTADGEMDIDFINLFNRLHLIGPNHLDYDKVNNLTFLPVIRPYDYDYFTSSLPEKQHGPVMTIPLELVNSDDRGNRTFKLINTPTSSGSSPIGMEYTSGATNIRIGGIVGGSVSSANSIVVDGSVFENVATIESLREAERVLEFFESLGLVGWKPEDFNLSQFNSHTKDNRLMISDRLHHEVFDVNVGEVWSSATSSQLGDSVQHNVPGVATSTAKGYGRGEMVKYRVPEYGYIFGIMSIYPEPAYSQGIPKHFDMLDRFDYPNPKFANLGLEPIYNRELYQTGQAGDDGVFGYTTRYASYKTHVSRINSEFRNSYSYMSLSRLFNKHATRPSRPALNEAFNKVQVGYNDLNRCFNVSYPLLEDGPVIIDMLNHIDANRPLPYYGTPRL